MCFSACTQQSLQFTRKQITGRTLTSCGRDVSLLDTFSSRKIVIREIHYNLAGVLYCIEILHCNSSDLCDCDASNGFVVSSANGFFSILVSCGMWQLVESV